MTETVDFADFARFLNGYARRYGAGAFATPMATELADGAQVVEWRAGAERTVAVVKHLRHPARRRDFTGAAFAFPAGARIVTHLARTPDAPVPDVGAFDCVFTHREDEALSAGLRAQGRRVDLMQVSAAGELIAGWGWGGPALAPHDVATLVRLPVPLDPVLIGKAQAEVRSVSGWHDDYPFYSDGTWGAVSLRGFRPDPAWGVKPAEMPRRWKAEHPEALAYWCDWTTLAPRVPALRVLAETVAGGRRTERVRLMRMAGRPGGGRLARHSDITDRAHGTRDGAIVRLHVPLLTHGAIVMHAWDLDGRQLTHHLAPGEVWYLDARKPHAVDNPTATDRVHLTVDVHSDAALRQALARARLTASVPRR